MYQPAHHFPREINWNIKFPGVSNHAAKADSKPKKLKVQPALLLQGQLGGKQQQARLEVIETNAVIELLLLMAEILHQFIGSLSHYF